MAAKAKSNFLNLPFQKIFVFLKLKDRTELFLASKRLSHLVSPTLTPSFDTETSYSFYRSCLLSPKKKQKSLPTTTYNSSQYHVLELPIFKLPPQIKQSSFEFESTENGLTVFSNTHSDKLIVHSSLVQPPELPESSFEFLANASDLNEDIDFSNPLMLLKRQKNLLNKVSNYREQLFEQQKQSAMRFIKNWGDVVIILCHGGNFNIASFKPDGSLAKSNSDHKYVTRKKQGGRQSTTDKHKGGIHSMGASIRRENEKKHSENIQSFVEENEQALNKAGLIFLHAPGNNYYTFIGENGLLQRWKEKVRSVGMTTGKAKLQEAERVFAEISMCRVLIKS